MNKNNIKFFFYLLTNLIFASFWLWNTYVQFSYFLFNPKISVLLMAFCQGFTGILFLIRKPPQRVSHNVFATVTAFLGSFLILLYRPSATPDSLIGEILISIGACLLFYSLVSLNRSFGIIPADREIKTKGMYAFVRHPIYMSYIFFYIGYCINNPKIYNIVLMAIVAILEYIRILFEEKHLSQNPAYMEYKKKVKYRLIPYII